MNRWCKIFGHRKQVTRNVVGNWIYFEETCKRSGCDHSKIIRKNLDSKGRFKAKQKNNKVKASYK